MSRICVKNLPKYVVEDRLREFFSQKGEITDVKLMRTKDGKSRQFAFVGFRTNDEAQEAIRYFNRSYLDTSRITCEVAQKLGDANLPRPWSQHSTKKDKKATTPDANKHAGAKGQVDNSKDIVEPELQDFIQVMQPRAKSKLWANDTSIVSNVGNNLAISIKERKSALDAVHPILSQSVSSADEIPNNPEPNKSRDLGHGVISDMDYFKSKVTSEWSDSESSSNEDDNDNNDSACTDDDTNCSDASEHEGNCSNIPSERTPISGAQELDLNGQEDTSGEDVANDKAQVNAAEESGQLPNPEDEKGVFDSCRLFVRNLPYGTTEEELEEHFSQFGSVSQVHLVVEKETRRSKGIAYVRFSAPEFAARALEELDNTIFQGRLLHVMPAIQRTSDNTEKNVSMDDGSKTLKQRREEERKANEASGDTRAWNSLFMRSDTNDRDTHRDLKRKLPQMDRGQGPEAYNTNSRPYDKNAPPDGWFDCPEQGQELGCLIPSKVPLGESFNDRIPSEKYTPKQAILQQRVLGRELGLVIDLTNTTRYYPLSDWTKEGIRHVKIRCKGRDSVPDDESVKKFCDEVLDFRSRETNIKKYILVHCTHGFNRTGYMIAQFLVRTESISVTEAINKFAQARHPGIYKPDYIDALYTSFHENKPGDLVCPQTPEWKTIAVSATDNYEDILQQEITVGNGLLTNDDLLGDPIPPNQLRSMQEVCYQLLKMGTGGKGRQFPGSHPVSLNRDNLQLLRQRYYYATWKADGTRYMMLITWDGCYLIDRKFLFRRIDMRFPCRYSNGGTPERNHHYTLLDGEMIIDTDPHTHKQERRYLIYDLIAINQVSLTELPFYERWKLLEKEVIEPRNMEREGLSKSTNPYYRYDLEPFSVRRKGFWLLSTVSKLLHKFIPQLSHSSDGLVFQGWDDPYVPRTHEGLLKWKYPEMNSVDFHFEVGSDNRPLLFLFERGRKKLMEGNNVIFKDASDASDIASYSGKIIECYWDAAKQYWVCMRVRTDKATPNDINTYRKVMRSIKDNITEEVLLKEIGEIIRLPLYADRIQRDIKAHQHMVSSRRK